MTEPETLDVVPSPAIRRAVRVRRIVGHAVSATLVVAAASGAAVLGTVDRPQRPAPLDVVAVPVPPVGADLVCPGPLRLPTEQEPGEDVVYDPQFDPRAAQSTTTVVGAGDERTSLAWAGLDATAEPAAAAAASGAVSVLEAPGDATVLRARPDGGEAGAAAAVLTRTAEGDLRGIAAASCRAAGAETWLVGGSTAVGSSARLVLQNPGRTPASVELSLWGATGAVELAGAPEFLVPAGSARVVLLEGVAAEQRRLVTSVRSTGGLVTAYLQDSELRGLVPAGVDLVVGTTAPARTVVLPGLAVTASDTSGADTSTLRLLSAEAATTARVQILGPDGAVPLPGTGELSLAAGEVLDVPLGGLPAGVWSVVVQADAPVVAGALLTRGLGVGGEDLGSVSTLPLDRAWLPGVPTSASGDPATTVVLPDAQAASQATVALVTPPGSRPGEAEVELLDVDGRVLATERVALRPGTTATLSPADVGAPEAAVVRVVSARGAVAWSVVLVDPRSDGDAVAVLTPAPLPQVRSEVPVTVD